MTVGELIEHLKSFPQDVRVTGYHGGENTGFVTPAGIRLQDAADHGVWDDVLNDRYYGPHVDIMGF